METAPWWAAPAIGLVGVAVGAIIGLVGTWIATSRQIAHHERESRAVAYASFVSAANEALDAAATFDGKIREKGVGFDETTVSDLRRDVLTGGVSRERLERQFESLQVQDDEQRRALRQASSEYSEALRKLHVCVLEVGLLGPPAMHDAAHAVALAVGLDEEGDNIPTETFTRALAEFMTIARRDLRAPSRLKWEEQGSGLPKGQPTDSATGSSS